MIHLIIVIDKYATVWYTHHVIRGEHFSPTTTDTIEGGLFAMSKYSIEFGRLEYLSRREYTRGDWVYVASEELDDDGVLYDIVRSADNTDWRYTQI